MAVQGAEFAVLHRYTNVELPVYGSDTPVAITHDEVLAASRSQESFLRAVCFTPPTVNPVNSLVELLEAGDKALTSVASYCGAVVVEHSWALYKSRDGQPLRPLDTTHPLQGLPDGHFIVADVQAIPDAFSPVLDKEAFQSIWLGIIQFLEQPDHSRELKDLRPSQFVVQPLQKKRTLVDLDCYFA